MILDSGERREFSSGAVRDSRRGKGRMDLLPLEVVYQILSCDPIIRELNEFLKQGNTQHLYLALELFYINRYEDRETMILEVAKQFEDGAEKYGENNWQKGLPPNVYIDSALRHYIKYRRGDSSEPNDRAFVWNIMCCIWEVDHHTHTDTHTHTYTEVYNND